MRDHSRGFPIRRLLLVPALVGVAAIVYPAVAGAGGPEPDQAVNEAAITAPAETAAPGFTEALDVDEESNLVGLKWNGDANTQFSIEVQEPDGTWGEPLTVGGLDIGPDEGTPEAQAVAARRGSGYITEPVAVVDPDKVRVRVEGGAGAAGVELVTIGGDAARPTDDPGPTDTTSPPPTTAPATTAPPPTSTPPVTSAPVDTTPPPELEPPDSGPVASEASMLTWIGLALSAGSVGAYLVVRFRPRRRSFGRHGRKALLMTLVLLGGVAVAGCVGTAPPRPTFPQAWPQIFPRSSWGGPDVAACAGYAPSVRFTVVHHTGGGPADNNYSDGAAKVRSIYNYHVTAGGFCDIAYNFLIDKNGTIFEGRDGGWEQPVIGAHTLNYNTESTGVAIMGDFTSQNAPGAAQESLIKLLAWKMEIHHINPHVLVPKNGRNIYAVSAHRELFPTSCPGNAFYPELPRIGHAAAARVFYGDPVGYIDTYERLGGQARATGWALDPDWTGVIRVDVYVNQQGTLAVMADRPKAGLADWYPAWGNNHGFTATVAAPPGAQVCAIAINVSHGSNAPLGCANV